ncbi:Dabb family protein [Lacihabitans sp. LS3-19]|uniref:Dabb family protein n=1 Tax=Lacihabitans sp. LS3-19 TaxID=2487335 RepID=UPI0020CD9846|nr:Dabb family protein [Lacihabitans sp. LS3-19]MCP9770697.1 Dabb family protein [Lacihabitans sp. LS3-19]
MKNRRDFLKNAAVLSALPIASVVANQAKSKDLFIHHVFFYLKEDKPENRAKLTEGLLKLSKVPQIKLFNIGEAANTTRSVIVRDYAISWLCFFDNIEEEEIYQKHPIHLKFIEDYAYLWEKVNVYDAVGPRR